MPTSADEDRRSSEDQPSGHAHADSLRDRIVAHELLTPVDLEEEFGLSGGHLFQGEQALDQWASLRPHAECSRYTTPLTGLVLGGSGCHPGGGLTGVPGRLSALAAIQELPLEGPSA